MRKIKFPALFISVIFFITSISCGGGSEGDNFQNTNAKSITSFLIVNPATTGIINELTKTISLTLPYGTDSTALVASFVTTGTSVTIGSVVQESGSSVNDFSSSVVYTVYATDDSFQDYVVTAAVSPTAPSIWSISGNIDTIDASVISSASPMLFAGVINYGTNPYDSSDYRLLNSGTKKIIDAGSGIHFSMAFDVLYHKLNTSLYKTGSEISYLDAGGKFTDFEIIVGGAKLGVVVTRGYVYPTTADYTSAMATSLLTAKLGVITQSTANVASADAWSKQILFIFAYSSEIATTLTTAWDGMSAATKGNTILIIVSTDGDDNFIYE